MNIGCNTYTSKDASTFKVTVIACFRGMQSDEMWICGKINDYQVIIS